MKFINKKPNNEPRAVMEKRVTIGSTFDDLPKNELRKALLSEQGYICAYCMQRINNSPTFTKIEHWSPRKKENEKDYMNLLAVCKGNEGNVGLEHCDTLKKNQIITVSPLKKECEQMVKFDPGGQIYSDDLAIDKELKEILGLDKQHIVEERKRLIDAVKFEIEIKSKKSTDKKAKKALLNNLLKEWELPSNGKYKPYCQVAIVYINKKLSRL